MAVICFQGLYINILRIKIILFFECVYFLLVSQNTPLHMLLFESILVSLLFIGFNVYFEHLLMTLKRSY